MGSSMSVAALEVVVTAYAGEPIATPMVGKLQGDGELTIGRNPSNDLVLDDPARQVSRFQAKVAQTGFGIELSNVSNQSCILVNGTEIKPSGGANIKVGDTIVMGRYVLELRASESAQHPAISPSNEKTPEEDDWRPMGVIPEESAKQIPDDYDVFAAPDRPEDEEAQPLKSLREFSETQNKALLEDLNPASRAGQDSLFVAQPAAKGAVLGLVDDKLDPMKLFDAAPEESVSGTVALDHASEMESLIKLPIHEETKLDPSTEQATGVYVSSGSSVEVEAALIPPDSSELETEEPDSTERENLEAGQLSSLALIKREGSATKNAASLKDALADGCGVCADALPEVTPEFMRELGIILKTLSDGTVRLMHARSMTKHEMRANVTIIASAGNNPIKFAPDGTAALQQMLGKRFSGFMPPIEAIEDAFDDLSAHQLGLLAGARRATLEMFRKLKPETIAATHEPQGLGEKLLPLVKDAKLWRKYKHRYKELSDDEEGFANLIEKSFVKSYEDEIDRIYAGRSQ